MATIAKAIAAFITSGIAAAASAGFLPEEFNSPEFIGAITAIVTTLFVYFVPNKK